MGLTLDQAFQVPDFRKLRMSWGSLGVYQTGDIFLEIVAKQVLDLILQHPLFTASEGVKLTIFLRDGTKREENLELLSHRAIANGL